MPAFAATTQAGTALCRARSPWVHKCVMMAGSLFVGTHLMSAFLVFLDRRFERLFHLLEKGTLDKRRRFETDR